MTENDQIEILLSKKKMILLFLGSIVFVSVGILFLINPSIIKNHDSVTVSIVGVTSILVFGLAAVIFLLKLFDKKPGLIINKQGVFDNSSGLSAGLILWADIEKIQAVEFTKQNFIMVIVKNPEDYIDRVKNPLKRMGMKLNYKIFGSPIYISTNLLQTNFKELHKLLSEKLEVNKN